MRITNSKIKEMYNGVVGTTVQGQNTTGSFGNFTSMIGNNTNNNIQHKIDDFFTLRLSKNNK